MACRSPPREPPRAWTPTATQEGSADQRPGGSSSGARTGEGSPAGHTHTHLAGPRQVGSLAQRPSERRLKDPGDVAQGSARPAGTARPLRPFRFGTEAGSTDAPTSPRVSDPRKAPPHPRPTAGPDPSHALHRAGTGAPRTGCRLTGQRKVTATGTYLGGRCSRCRLKVGTATEGRGEEAAQAQSRRVVFAHAQWGT